MTRGLVCTLLALVLLAGVAAADVVHLKNGNTLEGEVTRAGDDVVVKTRHGTITLSSDEVIRVEESRTVLDEFAERRAKIADDDVEARFRLALWLKQEGHEKKCREELEAILKLDPRHRGAHHTLGHVRYDGKWMTQDEAMVAQGYVKHEGRWVTAEEKVLLERNTAYRARVLALQAKVTGLVRAMASPSKALRKKYHRELVTLAREIESPELEAKANEVSAWYDRAYRAAAGRALLEVRAQMATLKRPIPTFTTSLGASSTPVTLHLPEVALVSIGTTVTVPVGK